MSGAGGMPSTWFVNVRDRVIGHGLDGKGVHCSKRCEAAKSKARAKLEALAWKHTHRDFKSTRENGVRVVSKLIEGSGTCSVELSSLTDAELLAKLPSAVRAAVSS